MRILHVVRQYQPSVGGLEAYVKSMATHQQALGHQVEVLTLNRLFGQTHDQQPRLPAHEMIDGIPVTRISFVGFQRFFIPFISLRFVKGFDILHVHNTDGFFDALALLKPLHRRPMVATTHGGFFHTKVMGRFKQIYFNTVTRLSAKAYGTLFAISENDLDIFRTITSNLVLQPNAVEPLGDFTATGPDFIYIGRLAEHKMVENLIRTFAVFVNEHKGKGNLHIVGPEWDVARADLTNLANTLGLSKRVKIHGFTKPAALTKILQSCGYFVSASLFEGFGMSMIEGMSVGLIPLVQPNASFQVLVKQSKVGACIDYTNPTDAAAAMAECIATVKPAHSTTARTFAATFAWPKLAAACVAIYKKEISA
ncbi:MAG: glycosyltransferase family 4 protein [Alphaproteobacteria bacterium]